MQEPKVEIVDASIGSSSRGLISGIIFFDFGPFQFPESNWNDVVVVVLGWWLSALVDLLGGHTSEVDLRFMEGSLWVSVQRKYADQCVLRCVEGPKENIQFEGEGSALALLKSTLTVAMRIQKICDQQGWRSADVEALGVSIKSAQKMTMLQ